MTNAQAERAVNQLYESDSIRSELRDEEASLLLSWGEVQLTELAKQNLPDDQFDHLSEKFRSMLAAINICVGKRKTTPSQHLPMMASISSAADEAGYQLQPEDQTTFLKAQGAMTNQDAISELLGLLKPAEKLPPMRAIEPEPVPQAPPSEPASEIITPQAAPEVVDSTQPPQPEELPEIPQQPPASPPQEGQG